MAAKRENVDDRYLIVFIIAVLLTFYGGALADKAGSIYRKNKERAGSYIPNKDLFKRLQMEKVNVLNQKILLLTARALVFPPHFLHTLSAGDKSEWVSLNEKGNWFISLK